LSQETENALVEQELNLIDSSTNIFKMVGPVLIKHSLEDAKDTVSKRLEFIQGEKKRLESKISELEERGKAKARNIQQMQASLQQATVTAVQQIRQEAAAAGGGATAGM
jgi:prefoldin beta subunit